MTIIFGELFYIFLKNKRNFVHF